MNRTLLIVDDEENIIRSLVRLLRRDGYHILTAISGYDGLKMLEDNNVGVVISDQRMPQMTGVEFLSKVKDLYPDTIRIVLSGYTDLNSITDAINQGAIYKFFTKPWDDDLLSANISDAFKTYELRQENEQLKKDLETANNELTKINENLEHSVEQKTREIMFNLRALQVSQDVLENLPVGVLGIDSEGIIVIANQRANTIIGREGIPLVGCSIEKLISGAMNNLLANDDAQMTRYQHKLDDSSTIEISSCHFSSGADAKGTILVLNPN